MCFINKDSVFIIYRSAKIAFSDSVKSSGANWGIIGEVLILFVVCFTSVTNCDSSGKILIFGGFQTALISSQVDSGRLVISKLFSVNLWVVHFVGIEINIEEDFRLYCACIVFWVVNRGIFSNFNFFASKGELVGVVDYAIFVVSKAAHSFVD